MIDIPSRTCSTKVRNYLVVLLLLTFCMPTVSLAELVSSVLPTSRSVLLGNSATAFATVINTGPGVAIGCSIRPITSVPANFLYQTTDPATNVTVGTVNTPVNIAEGKAQTFLFAFTPTKIFSPTEIALDFGCQNTNSANSIKGINTILLSSSNEPVPDIISIPSSSSHFITSDDGEMSEVFSVATANVGEKGSITLKQDEGSVSTPVSFKVCQTNPLTGACINPVIPSNATTTFIDSGDTPTFSVYANALDPSVNDLVNNRVFIKFTDTEGVKRGTVSIALSAQTPNSNPTPTTGSDPIAAEEGVWSGTVVNSAKNTSHSIYARILKNNKIQILNITDDGMSGIGKLNISGNTLSSTVNRFIPGNENGTIRINAAYVPKKSIDGKIRIFPEDQSGDIILSYIKSTIQAAGNSYVAGTTNLLSSSGQKIGSINFNQSGVINGSDSTGCIYSGSSQIIKSNTKLLSLSITVSNCGAKDGKYGGLASVDEYSNINDISIYSIN